MRDIEVQEKRTPSWKEENSPIYGGGKSLTQVDRDGFTFFMLESLWVAFWLSIGVSWGVVSFTLPFLAMFFTWLFWNVGIVGLFIYTPCVCWWAYKRGVFEDDSN